MAPSTESSAEVEKKMAELTKTEYERSGLTQKKFLDYFISINAQAVTDKVALINAGLNPSNIPLYLAMQEKLALSYGQRYGTINQNSEQKTYFDLQYPISEKEKKYMLLVARHIVERSGDIKVEKAYKQIVKGSGILDTLVDVITLKPLIMAYLLFASEIKPGGTVVDSDYITKAAERAIELLNMKGFVIEQGLPVNNNVDQLNRITTLCVRAIAEIKKFAEAAFIEDPEYLKENYSNPPTSKDDKDQDDEDALSTPSVATANAL
jgi:hypothetical protein